VEVIMARTAPEDKAERLDWYAELTNKIIEALEAAQKDPAGWRKPWQGLWKYGTPQNGATGRKYNGLNVWLLALAGHSDSRWYTYKQAEGLKAQVRKGEKGTKVFFWQFLPKYADQNGNPVYKPTKAQIASGEVKVVGRVPFLKVYTVFNADQIDGLPVIDIPVVDPGAKYLQAEALMTSLEIDINHVPGSDTACYRPGADCVVLPAPGQFDTVENYWATAMHEVVHWTGHKDRLDRDLSDRFGGDAYAFEELVAELGAAFLCAHLGIEGDLRHPQYIASWLKRLRQDKFAVFKAASLAQKAVDYVLAGGDTLSKKDEDTSDVDPSTANTEADPAQEAA
jgi:antirestriction protein ArdC